MWNLIRITEAANLAVHALAFLSSREREGRCSVAEIAGHLGVSENHLAKVLQRLAKHQFIRSSRGAKGGFVLLREPSTIRLLDVLEAIDGPLSSESCLLGRALCRPGTCLFRDLMTTIRGHLERTTIADYRAATGKRRGKR